MRMEIIFKNRRKIILNSVASFNVTDSNEVVRTPTVGMLFEINPLKIDKTRFETPREDSQQEWTRKIIRKAFEEIFKLPEKYAMSFYTLIPEKNGNGHQTVSQLEEYAEVLGGTMVDWVEQALEWAQRLDNGESWEDVCNKEDNVKVYRVIIWKNGRKRIVGGKSATNVYKMDYDLTYRVTNAVPLIKIPKV